MFSTHFLRGVLGLLTALALTSAGQAQLPRSLIAFHSNRDGNEEIYVMNPDGTDQTRLTNHPALDSHPAWSPDGTRIAFASKRHGKWHASIFVMNADGTNPIQLTDFPDTSPSWSPDGTRITFYSSRDDGVTTEIYVMNADGSNQTRLTNNTAVDQIGSPTAWSPDSRRIVFDSNRDGNKEIYVMNADGTNPVNLTNQPRSNDYAPSWSPDGARIAFWTNRDGNNEIYVMNVDGSGQTRLTNHPGADYGPSWSPDGSRIVFYSTRDGNQEIYVMNADGSNQTRLTNSPGVDQAPDWSPFLMLEVLCDVKPGPEPNEINLRGQGVIPVAILTTPQFDARMVDPLSVVFGPGQAREAHGQGHLEDVDGDGDIDMMLHFRTQESGIQPGDMKVTLSGRTVQGKMFKGSDGIVTR